MVLKYKEHIFKLWLFVFISISHGILTAQPISLSARKMKSIQIDGHGGQLLKGNVQFEQQGSRVYCDEAEYDPQTESLKGYGDVKIVNAEGTVVTGNTLIFDNATHTAKVDGNVKLVDNTMTLLTPWLQYNTQTRVGWYGSGGVITDKKTKLTSVSGSYNPVSKTLFFKQNVVLQTPDYTIKTDTLQYNTQSKTARFFSFTQLEYETQTMVFERGNYSTETEQGTFYQKVGMFDNDKTLVADSVYVNKKNKRGTAYKNVFLVDSVENWRVWGQKADYTKNTGEITITGNPLALQIDKSDSFFIKADTLFYSKDSATQYQKIKAWWNVKFKRNNVSGTSKTLEYQSVDSTFKLRGNPVLWDSLTRMSGDTINLFLKNKKLSHSTMYQHGFIAMQEDETRFSQISGDSMTHLLDANQKLTQTLVHKNGKSVYFMREKDSISSVFDIECSNIKFNFTNNKISNVYFYIKPIGKIYPLDLFPQEKNKLPGFKWDIENKPNRSIFGSQFTPLIPKTSYALNPKKANPSKKGKKKKDKK